MEWTSPAPQWQIEVRTMRREAQKEGAAQMTMNVIGLDLAKNVFQVHAVNSAGEAVLRRKLRRAQLLPFFAELAPCLVGMEACSTSHYWARELIRLGHDVRIIPPSYVKPFLRRNKNDALDAEAICEAVQRPNMRFVPVKSEAQQAALMLHKTRHALRRQQVRLINMLRGHMAELGYVVPLGSHRAVELLEIIESDDESLPAAARAALRPLAEQLSSLKDAVKQVDAEIVQWHRSNSVSKRLATIPGIGIITASAIAASVAEPGYFKSAREFAAWLGLTPRQNSTGGKQRLGRISKAGNGYIRQLLVLGATSLVKYARSGKTANSAWVNGLLARRPVRLVIVAIANKAARIAWAIMCKQQVFRSSPIVAAS
jgi:transposase